MKEIKPKIDNKQQGGPIISSKTHITRQHSIERRARFKDLCNAALVEWRQLLAAVGKRAYRLSEKFPVFPLFISERRGGGFARD